MHTDHTVYRVTFPGNLNLRTSGNVSESFTSGSICITPMTVQVVKLSHTLQTGQYIIIAW